MDAVASSQCREETDCVGHGSCCNWARGTQGGGWALVRFVPSFFVPLVRLLGCGGRSRSRSGSHGARSGDGVRPVSISCSVRCNTGRLLEVCGGLDGRNSSFITRRGCSSRSARAKNPRIQSGLPARCLLAFIAINRPSAGPSRSGTHQYLSRWWYGPMPSSLNAMSASNS